MFEPCRAEKIHEPIAVLEKQVQLPFSLLSQVQCMVSAAKVSWLCLFPLSLLGLGFCLILIVQILMALV